MAGEDRAHRRAVPRGRQRRRAAAHRRREPRAAVGPGGDRRQPAGRGGQHRRGRGVPGRARRLHAAVGAAAVAGDQPPALSQAAVRLDAVRADDGDRGDPQRAARAPEAGRRVRGGPHFLREEKPRQAQLRVARQRRHFAPHHRALQVDGRRCRRTAEHHPRALQGYGAGAGGPAGRAGGHDGRQPRRFAAARELRQAESARSSEQPALPLAARRAGARRDAAGIRVGIATARASARRGSRSARPGRRPT